MASGFGSVKVKYQWPYSDVSSFIHVITEMRVHTPLLRRWTSSRISVAPQTPTPVASVVFTPETGQFGMRLFRAF